VLGILLRVLGVGALVAGGVVVAVAALVATLLLGPLVFWVAWNVLDFGHAVGLPELGFWGIVLATVFLVVGWFPKVVITAIVFLVDPSWFQGTAQSALAGADLPQLRRRCAARPARVAPALTTRRNAAPRVREVERPSGEADGAGQRRTATFRQPDRRAAVCAARDADQPVDQRVFPDGQARTVLCQASIVSSYVRGRIDSQDRSSAVGRSDLRVGLAHVKPNRTPGSAARALGDGRSYVVEAR